MANAYWFIPSRVDEAIDALQDLGYVIDIEKFRKFVGLYVESNLIVYRLKEGLSHSTSNLEECKKSNIHDNYTALLGPKELIFTDEYKESQNSFAELCNPIEYIYDDSVPF